MSNIKSFIKDMDRLEKNSNYLKQIKDAGEVIHFLVEKYCSDKVCADCPVHDECTGFGDFITKIDKGEI